MEVENKTQEMMDVDSSADDQTHTTSAVQKDAKSTEVNDQNSETKTEEKSVEKDVESTDLKEQDSKTKIEDKSVEKDVESTDLKKQDSKTKTEEKSVEKDVESTDLKEQVSETKTTEDKSVEMDVESTNLKEQDSKTKTEEKSVEMDVESKEQDSASKNGASENGVNDRCSELDKKIIKQIDFYFGDYNLPRDKFLKEEIKKDDGWVPLTTMLKFARLSKITSDAGVIVAAIKSSNDTIMEVDSTDEKIRRSKTVPLPDLTEDLQEESIKRTIYCKGFPKDGSIDLDELLAFYKPFGEYDAVRMRNFQDKDKKIMGFKGSVLVVFKTQELAKAFIDGPATMYKKTYLIKKWFGDYLGEKKQEYEDRHAKKAARVNDVVEKDVPEPTIAAGSFLKATGFAADTAREDITSALQDLTGDCQFVDFRKNDESAYLRFSGNNKEILAALQGNLKVNGANIAVTMVSGDEEEVQIAKAKESMRNAKSRGDKKRKGNFGKRGGFAKRGRR